MKNSCLKQTVRRTGFTAALFAAALLGFTAHRASATDIAYFRTIYGTDFSSAGVGAMRDIGNGTITLTGVTGTVTRAYLYWAGPMNSPNPTANAVVMVNNQTVVGVNIGNSQDNCWGFLMGQAYRADVTALVQAKRNGAYALSRMLKPGININGASLLVFFDDGKTNNNRDVVIFDGNDANASNSHDADGWNVTLSGINYTSGTARMQLHVSDGQSYLDEALIVNGTTIFPKGAVFSGDTVPGINNGPGGLGRMWDIKSFPVNSLMSRGANSLTMTHAYNIGNDCVDLVVAVIDLPAGAAPVATNHPPTITSLSSMVVTNPGPTIVQAHAADEDGDTLSFTISLNGTLVRSGTIGAVGPVTTGTRDLTNDFPLGTHVVTFFVSDGKADASTAVAVTVSDLAPPIINCSSNLVRPTDPGKASAVVAYTVTATDNFPGVSTVCLPPSGSAFAKGTTTVNCTAVDGAGHRSTCSFTVTVVDGEAPNINCVSNLVKYLDAGTNAVVTYAVTASDNVPGVRVACVPPSGSTFPMGLTTVSCKAIDTSSNVATCTFTVSVLDNRLSLPAINIVHNTDPDLCSAVVVYPFRNLPPDQTTVCNPPSGATFDKGVTTVRCTATSAAGRSTNASFTVTVLDKELPILVCPANIIMECSNDTTKHKTTKKTTDTKDKQTTKDTTKDKDKDKDDDDGRVTWSMMASDNCPGVSVVCTPSSGSRFSDGVTVVNCSATDTSSNRVTCSFEVRIMDTTAPVITKLEASKSHLWPANHKMVEVKLDVKTKDDCSGVSTKILSVTSSEPISGTGKGDLAPDWQITGPLKVNLRSERAGSVPRVYTITVQAKDGAGNITLRTVLVTVEDKKTEKKTTHTTTKDSPDAPAVDHSME